MAGRDHKAKTHLKRAAHGVLRHAKDHFIPHEGNGFVPHALKHRVLLGYSVILILIKVLVVVAPIVLPSASLYSSAVTSANIVSLTNETRRSLGLKDLTVSDKLSEAAAAKAADMMKTQYFAHTSPAGVKPWSWIRGAGYSYQAAGENLAIHYTTAEDVEAGWLASPTHRANIVDRRFSDIGVGVVQGQFNGYPSIIVVQMFGKPLAVGKATVGAIVDSSGGASAPRPVTGTTAVAGASLAVATAPAADGGGVESADASDGKTKIVPNGNGYTITVEDPSLVGASLQLGASSTPLVGLGDGRWSADVVLEKGMVSGNGEQLSLVASTTGTAGQVISPIAWIAPTDRPSELFAFSRPEKSLSLFGAVTVRNLEDGVRRLYVVTMILLAAMLSISILVRIRVQRASVIGHATLVLLLAGLLTIV